MHSLKFTALALLVCAGVPAFAQYDVQMPSHPYPIERYFQWPNLYGRSPVNPVMSPNGKEIVFGWNRSGARRLNVWIMNYPAGTKAKLVDAATIHDLPNQDDKRTEEEKAKAIEDDGGIGQFTWSPDSSEIMFPYKGRTWLIRADGTGLHPLFDSASGARDAHFSPDGKSISYVQGANLFRLDAVSGMVHQITFFSAPKTSVSSYEWAPDSSSLYVVWNDSSKTGHAEMMDFTKNRAKVVDIDREWNGDLNVDEKIGIVPADGGLVKFVSGLPTYLWTKHIDWSPDSKSLAIGWISGDFMEYSIDTVDLKTLKPTVIYHEKAPENYITDWRPLVWSRDSKRLIFGTDILNGKLTFRSVEEMDANGKNLHDVFAEKEDVGALARPKNSDRLVLVVAAPTPLQTEIVIIEPDGKRTIHDVKPGGTSVPLLFDSADLPLFSDDGKSIATLASDRTSPPDLYAVEPSQNRLLDSRLASFQKIQFAATKEVTFPGPDEAILHGILIYDPKMDMTKPHPAVVSNIYADSGKAGWHGIVENYLAMSLHMVVLSVDFRASWGYGGEFDSGYYKKMGLIDSDEAVDAHKYLASLPYVRADRIGIWGWSYGGYLTLMTLFRHPGVFHCGVAVAPVTDWTTYNEWYTRRRLGLVKDDKAIFEKTSPITYASGLQDDLLIIHGILDNNVLFQNTAYLSEKLIQAGKYFYVRVFPKDDHSISHDSSAPNVFGTITRYLAAKLLQP